MIRLSTNFTLKELLRSDTADRRGYQEQYLPPTYIIFNLKLLTREILQPVRDFFRLPLRIPSGYRCERVNQAVGGASSSQHRLGLAADIEGYDESVMVYLSRGVCPCGNPIVELRDGIDDDTYIVNINAAIMLFIAFNLEGKYDQLISEYGSEVNPSWVHCSVPNPNKVVRGEILRKSKGQPYVKLTKEELWDQITG